METFNIRMEKMNQINKPDGDLLMLVLKNWQANIQRVGYFMFHFHSFINSLEIQTCTHHKALAMMLLIMLFLSFFLHLNDRPIGNGNEILDRLW